MQTLGQWITPDSCQAEAREAALRPASILIVDDDVAVRRMVRRCVEKFFPEALCREAGDGIQALRMAAEQRPDCVLLDFMLPGQSGLQVCRSLRAMCAKPAVIIGMTGYASSANMRLWMEQGVAGCLVKPFEAAALRRLLGGGALQILSAGAAPQWKSSAWVRRATCWMGLALALLNPERSQAETPVSVENVAVLPFKSFVPLIDGRMLSEALVERMLKKIPKLQVVERQDIQSVLSEQAFQLTGAVHSKGRKSPGNLEAVKFLVLGSVRALERMDEDGGAIVVVVKVVDAGSGRIVWSHKQESRCYSLGIDRDELAQELTDRAVGRIVKKMKAAKQF